MFGLGGLFSALAVGLQKASEVTQDVGQRIGLPDWMTNSLAGTFELAGSAFGRSSGSGTQTAEAEAPNSPSNGSFFTRDNHEVSGAQLAGTGEKLGRNANNARMLANAAPVAPTRFDHNPAEAFIVPTVGDAAAGRGLAGAGVMTA